MMEVLGVSLPIDQIVFIFLAPYCVWVTVSIFNQRQELALIRQMLEELTEEFKIINAQRRKTARSK